LEAHPRRRTGGELEVSARADPIPAQVDAQADAPPAGGDTDAGRPLLGAPGLVAPFVLVAVALAFGAYPLGGTALLAALFLFLPRLFNADAIGMGDVKLGLLIGAALGWGAASALALGFLFVFPVALARVIRGGAAARRATIPMGPFLALGALVALLGPGLVGN
jgi:leader peptidase (prepilin peptidase)/N-methyltransferase